MAKCVACGFVQVPEDANFCPRCASLILPPPPIDFSRYVADHTAGFSGREWVFRAVDGWLADEKAPRVLLLTGEAGCGKTAIAARLVQFSLDAAAPPEGARRLGPGVLSAYHFCSGNHRWINPHRFCEAMAHQLGRYPEFLESLVESRTLAAGRESALARGVHQVVQQVSPHGVVVGAINIIERFVVGDATQPPEDVFVRLVVEPLHALLARQKGYRVVILVDALDEAIAYSGKANILSLLAGAGDLPAGVRLILATAPEGDVLRPIRALGAEELALLGGKWGSQSSEDVARYVLDVVRLRPALANILAPGYAPEDFCRDVALKTQGSFLRAKEEIKKRMEEGTTVRAEDVTPRPVPLTTYFLQGLRRLTGGDLDVWEQKHEPVLGTLAVAQESLKESQLATMLGWHRSQVRRVLTRLLPFLDRAELVPASRRLYTIIHQAFARFLLDEDAAEEYWCEAPLQHGRIAAYIQSCAGDWSGCDPYCLEYAAYHFIQAGWADELERILTKEFSDASSQVLGWHMPFVRNLEQALEVISPERAARLCVQVIVGTRPNSLVNQRILYLLAGRIRPVLQAKGASLVRPGFQNDQIIEEALAWLEPTVPVESAVRALERLYARVKGPVRGFTGLALGATHSPLATPLLVEALGREERGIGWCIADALLDLGDRSVIPILIAEYGQAGAKPGHQTRILYVLGRMRATEAREAGLIEMGLTHRSRFARARAADMLWLLAPVPGAEAILWGRLGFSPEGPASDTAPAETQEYVLHRLVTALGRIGTEQSVAHLQRFRAETIPRRPVPETKDGARERGRLEQSLDRATHALESRYPGLSDGSQESG